jgi:predicted transcriptional regulator
MVLEAERWFEPRRFRALREAGASISEISWETGLHWRTVKKYLEGDGLVALPVAAPRRSGRGQVMDAYAHVVESGCGQSCCRRRR